MKSDIDQNNYVATLGHKDLLLWKMTDNNLFDEALGNIYLNVCRHNIVIRTYIQKATVKPGGFCDARRL